MRDGGSCSRLGGGIKGILLWGILAPPLRLIMMGVLGVLGCGLTMLANLELRKIVTKKMNRARSMGSNMMEQRRSGVGLGTTVGI